MFNLQVTSTTMELLPLVCLCLLTRSGTTFAEEGSKVIKVNRGNDVTLPCSLSTKEDIEDKLFVWKKDGQKELFLYEAGKHYNNVRTGQVHQFEGRVSHFPDKLKHGDASINIRKTKLADSGNYTCAFPRLQPSQIFHIQLVVVAAETLSIEIFETKDGTLLQCEIQGATPQPKLHWQDIAGNILPAGEPQASERGGIYNITLNTTVTKTGLYVCSSTQEEINHQISVVTYMYITGAAPEPSVTILDQTKDWSLLQCEVQGAPKPKLEWQDSAGNILPAEEPQVSERGSRYNIILQTNVTKTDRYRCVATQEDISHQIYTETYVFISGSKVIRVEEGSDVTLPCSLSTKENITDNLFDWRKDGQKVFLYDAGDHYNNGRAGQDEQFEGRVSHFPDELKHGDASIKIRNTSVTDSGDYTCAFPLLQPNQTFHIRLVVVDPILKDRSGENIPGAAAKPSIEIFETKVGVLLQCKVQGASPPLKLQWQDRAGNNLSAEETHTERGSRYNITLNHTVTKTGRYRCVATQEDISHQIYAETFVHICGSGHGVAVNFSALLLLLVVVVLLF